MPNAWLTIPLEDYEAHMESPAVQQIPVLSDLFRQALVCYRPKSVAILGVAGGNGLEHVDSAITRRVVGLDINQRYLEAVQQRFQALPGLELYCRNLREEELVLDQVDLVHAALIFEHTGMGRALENALALLAPSGTLCVVFQLPSATEQSVAPTGYPSLQRIKQDFTFIDAVAFQHLMAEKGFRLIEQKHRPLLAGKAFWFGAFGRSI